MTTDQQMLIEIASGSKILEIINCNPLKLLLNSRFIPYLILPEFVHTLR